MDTANTGRWQVFISHTKELRDFPKGKSYLAEVERAISAAGHVIADMRDFPAEDKVPAEMCVERVQRSSAADSRFVERVADLAAPIHGRERGDIVGENVRQSPPSRRAGSGLASGS
jgi:hypothetical protein